MTAAAGSTLPRLEGLWQLPEALLGGFCSDLAVSRIRGLKAASSQLSFWPTVAPEINLTQNLFPICAWYKMVSLAHGFSSL